MPEVQTVRLAERQKQDVQLAVVDEDEADEMIEVDAGDELSRGPEKDAEDGWVDEASRWDK
jgi:hypothetical protein